MRYAALERRPDARPADGAVRRQPAATSATARTSATRVHREPQLHRQPGVHRQPLVHRQPELHRQPARTSATRATSATRRTSATPSTSATRATSATPRTSGTRRTSATRLHRQPGVHRQPQLHRQRDLRRLRHGASEQPHRLERGRGHRRRGIDPRQHLDERRLLLRPRHRQERRLRRGEPFRDHRDHRPNVCSPVDPASLPRPGRRLRRLERPDRHRLGPHADRRAPPPRRPPWPPGSRRRRHRRRRSSTSARTPGSPASTRRPTRSQAASTPRTSSPRRSGTSSSAYRNPNLEYVVLVGGDSSVPFFRYPDPADLAPESWYVPPVRLDVRRPRPASAPSTSSARTSTARAPSSPSGARGSPCPTSRSGGSSRPRPRRSGMIDAYLEPRRLREDRSRPQTSLVTGYDFIADSAGRSSSAWHRRHRLAAGHRQPAPTPSSTTPGRRTTSASYLLGTTHYDLVYLAGHFDANALLAADFATTHQRRRAVRAPASTSPTRSCSAPAAMPATTSSTPTPWTGVTQTLDWAAGSRPEGRHAGRRHRLPVRRRRARRVQRAHLRRVLAPAAQRAPGRSTSGRRSSKSKLAYLAATPDIRACTRRRSSPRPCSACRCSPWTCPAPATAAGRGPSIVGATDDSARRRVRAT